MILFRILLATIIGTSLMTFFSYLMSEVRKKQFREPVLLNKLLCRMHISNISSRHPAGWVIHYGVGFFFNVLYWIIIKDHGYHPVFFLFVLLGALSGIFGCLVWEITFQFHPNPPKVDLKGFYGQLFFAHLFFGMGSWLLYKVWPIIINN